MALASTHGKYDGSKLFLSCDLVGSTKFKQQNKDWLPIFVDFYQSFPRKVMGLLDEERVPAGGFKLWKAVGDELIYVAAVQSESEIDYLVRLWIQAMDSYSADLRDMLLKADHGPKARLGTKGAAFLATFPTPDREVGISLDVKPRLDDTERDAEVINKEVLAGGKTSHLRDYIGPSIDTGFRIFAACDEHTFTMSLEVAWALAVHKKVMNQGLSEDNNYFLHGQIPLKGVWGERKYPIFAIDRTPEDKKDDIDSHLSAVSGRKTLSSLDVIQLAKACTSSNGWPSSIYLPGSNEGDFCLSHDAVKAERKRLNELRDESEKPPEPVKHQRKADAIANKPLA